MGKPEEDSYHPERVVVWVAGCLGFWVAVGIVVVAWVL